MATTPEEAPRPLRSVPRLSTDASQPRWDTDALGSAVETFAARFEAFARDADAQAEEHAAWMRRQTEGDGHRDEQIGQILAALAKTQESIAGALSETRQTRGIVARHGAVIAEMSRTLGQPPRDPAVLARESQSDRTQAEVEALEAGTGLAGEVARHGVHIAQLWRRTRWFVGAAGVAATVSPHVPAIIAWITGG